MSKKISKTLYLINWFKKLKNKLNLEIILPSDVFTVVYLGFFGTLLGAVKFLIP